MNKEGPDSTSTGTSSESGTPTTNRLYRVVPHARVMNVSRPVSQTAAKKNISSAVYYSWEKKV
jgi:hypothetical protein